LPTTLFCGKVFPWRDNRAIIFNAIKEFNAMATGTVKWYNPAKRFGFIKPDDGGSDVFVHASALEAAGMSMLDENQRVQYDLTESKGKTSATNLKLV
jgi:CspA family cold shock protein